MWKFLADYEKRTGSEVLAIPHNANMSNGIMFQMTDFKGNPINRSYAEQRIRWEPLYEVTQIKGDGETHPKLSPEDEFTDFETWASASTELVSSAPSICSAIQAAGATRRSPGAR